MPGQARRADGYRPRIGGPDHRIRLSQGEYLVLVELMNQKADQGVKRIHRRKGDGIHTLDVKPFLTKLLKLGLRAGWTKVPACYRGPDLTRG